MNTCDTRSWKTRDNPACGGGWWGWQGDQNCCSEGTASSIAQGCLLLAHMCSCTISGCFPKTDNPSSHSLCLRRRQEGISTWDNRAAAQPSCSHGPGETGCTHSPQDMLWDCHIWTLCTALERGAVLDAFWDEKHFQSQNENSMHFSCHYGMSCKCIHPTSWFCYSHSFVTFFFCKPPSLKIN